MALNFKEWLTIFSSEPKEPEPDPLTTQSLSELEVKLFNALQVVAQMRKAQSAFFTEKEKMLKQAHLIESKRLEAAVDLRLSELGIKAQS
jgi:hypothetical protein